MKKNQPHQRRTHQIDQVGKSCHPKVMLNISGSPRVKQIRSLAFFLTHDILTPTDILRMKWRTSTQCRSVTYIIHWVKVNWSSLWNGLVLLLMKTMMKNSDINKNCKVPHQKVQKIIKAMDPQIYRREPRTCAILIPAWGSNWGSLGFCRLQTWKQCVFNLCAVFYMFLSSHSDPQLSLLLTLMFSSASQSNMIVSPFFHSIHSFLSLFSPKLK